MLHCLRYHQSQHYHILLSYRPGDTSENQYCRQRKVREGNTCRWMGALLYPPKPCHGSWWIWRLLVTPNSDRKRTPSVEMVCFPAQFGRTSTLPNNAMKTLIWYFFTWRYWWKSYKLLRFSFTLRCGEQDYKYGIWICGITILRNLRYTLWLLWTDPQGVDSS